jgi:hypothetical protein
LKYCLRYSAEDMNCRDLQINKQCFQTIVLTCSMSFHQVTKSLGSIAVVLDRWHIWNDNSQVKYRLKSCTRQCYENIKVNVGSEACLTFLVQIMSWKRDLLIKWQSSLTWYLKVRQTVKESYSMSIQGKIMQMSVDVLKKRIFAFQKCYNNYVFRQCTLSSWNSMKKSC